MTSKTYILLTALIVGVSVFAFKGLDAKDSAVATGLKTPSMIPGAEAVRPVAAAQSGRVESLVSDIEKNGLQDFPSSE